MPLNASAIFIVDWIKASHDLRSLTPWRSRAYSA